MSNFYTATDQTDQSLRFYGTDKTLPFPLPEGAQYKQFSKDSEARSAKDDFEHQQNAVAVCRRILVLGGTKEPTAAELQTTIKACMHNDAAELVELFQAMKAAGVLDGKLRRSNVS